MPDTNQHLRVSHNEGASRFECEVDGRLSVADYEIRDGAMVLTHTEVPRELSGRGIAQKIVSAALDHARAHHLRVVAQCPYVAAYIERHPEYRDLVAE
jgi:predicted GNAT family acetyltransferase